MNFISKHREMEILHLVCFTYFWCNSFKSTSEFSKLPYIFTYVTPDLSPIRVPSDYIAIALLHAHTNNLEFIAFLKCTFT